MTTKTQIETASHTPGPWKQGEKHPARVFAGDCVIYAVHPMDEGTERPEEIANARLMASAPELLAALQAVQEAAERPANLGDGEPFATREEEIAAIARAAIAKATQP